MKSAIRLLMIFAVCGTLLLPGTALADEFKVLGKIKTGPGKDGKAFGLDKGAKKLSISLINGSGKDRIKVSSLKVVINGEEVFSPNEFSAGKKNKLASAIKTLEVDPELDVVDVNVEVGGKKGSEITLTVTGVYDDKEQPGQVIWFFDPDGDGVGCDTMTMLVDSDVPVPVFWSLVGGDFDDQGCPPMF